MTDRRGLLGLLTACLVLTVTPTLGDAPAADGPNPTPGLLATQVTMTFDRVGVRRERRQFRATVVSKGADHLTVLTAAHCLAPTDAGADAIVKVGDEVVEATIAKVVWNPSYVGDKDGELPGPDNALARLKVIRPSNRMAEAAFRALKPAAGLAAGPVPRPTGQAVSVRMIDGHGVEHALRAGNYANPRWLEWGKGYKPIAGDSGGGVFTLVRRKDHTVVPVLIGVIVGQSGPGGGASLVSLQQPWLAGGLE